MPVKSLTLGLTCETELYNMKTGLTWTLRKSRWGVHLLCNVRLWHTVGAEPICASCGYIVTPSSHKPSEKLLSTSSWDCSGPVWPLAPQTSKWWLLIANSLMSKLSYNRPQMTAPSQAAYSHISLSGWCGDGVHVRFTVHSLKKECWVP